MNDANPAQIRPISTDPEALNRVSLCNVCHTEHAPIIQLPQDQAIPLLAEFVASAGLIQEEGEDPRKMSMEEFAHLIGWSRRTLYVWIKSDPDWDARVFAAIRRVFGPKRIGRILRGVYVQAALGKQPQAELLLRQFWPDYVAPKEEKTVAFTGLAELYEAHAKTQRQAEQQERDHANAIVIDAQPALGE